MKTNQEFKSEARSALNGNWAQAVIATIIFMLLLSALCGPGYASVLNISAGSPLILPAYVTYGGTLLIVLVLYPLTAGFMNSFRILFETGDNRLSSNMFTVAFGEGRGWLHLVLGMLLTNVYILVVVAFSCSWYYKGVLLCDDTIYSRGASGAGYR